MWKGKSPEIRKYFKANENKNIAHLHLWDAAKAVLAGKILALNDYIGGKSYQINNPRN